MDKDEKKPVRDVKREWVIKEDGSRAYIVRKVREGDLQVEAVDALPTEILDLSIITELPPDIWKLQNAIFDEAAEPNRSQSFEESLKALRIAASHVTTREALIFEERHLRFIVQKSPVREKLNSWDAGMILANETRLENISKFLSLLDDLVHGNRVSQFEADEFTFLFHRTIMAAFEIGSVCYPSGSAAGQVRDMQSKAARNKRSKNKDERIEIAKPLILRAARSDGKILNMERLREQVNVALRILPEKNGKPVTISRDTLERYVQVVDEGAN